MTEERETEQAQQKGAQQVVGISEDDPIVQRLRENIKRETGVELDQLLNPSKVCWYCCALMCTVYMCQ